MQDADYFRGQAARCLTLQRQAKRADVRAALRCLARDYEGEAQVAERSALGLPPWPLLAMQRQMATLWRLNLAFWLGF